MENEAPKDTKSNSRHDLGLAQPLVNLRYSQPAELAKEKAICKQYNARLLSPLTASPSAAFAAGKYCNGDNDGRIVQ